MLEKIKGPDRVGREAMYYPRRQDFAHQHGAYDYLHSIAMVPRYAALAGYIQALEATKVLDIGCGTGQLLSYLHPDLTYVGVDISQTAVNTAKQRYARRENASFYALDARTWPSPERDFDAVVWAGIGCTWTRKGKGGDPRDWLEILDIADQRLKPGGIIILELVTDHWPTMNMKRSPCRSRPV